jgi:hypothetical protein
MATGVAERVAVLEAHNATLERAVAELTRAAAAIGGSGVLKRSPTAAGLLAAAENADEATIEYWRTGLRATGGNHDGDR